MRSAVGAELRTWDVKISIVLSHGKNRNIVGDCGKNDLILTLVEGQANFFRGPLTLTVILYIR